MANLNETPSAERTHITIFGRRNVGKSSLINALTGQNISIVSEKKGTTTDPVKKTMEILPLGAVLLTDTAGLDDEGDLGKLRIERTLSELATTDIAILVIDANLGWSETEENLVNLLSEKKIATIVVYNKTDLAKPIIKNLPFPSISISTKNNTNIFELKNLLANLKPNKNDKPLIHDLLQPNDLVILVTPIDAGAPKGRIILPQQQVLRDVLDAHAFALVTQPENLTDVLKKMTVPPRIVITDSQVFNQVNKILPNNIPLTSFSIIFARYKGDLMANVTGANVLDNIKDNDEILIAEGCTHHRQCEDIGSVKLPQMIKNYCQCTPHFNFTSGGMFPEDLKKYKLIIHCGACMLTQKEMENRYMLAKEQNIPITNYGIAIAKIHGILEKVIAPFE